LIRRDWNKKKSGSKGGEWSRKGRNATPSLFLEKLTEEGLQEQRRLEQEQERLEQERLEKEQLELEQERLEQERLENERLEKERLEKERLEQDRLVRDRIEQERLERLEREKLEQERLEQERLEKEHLESKGDTSGTQDDEDLSQQRAEKRKTQIDFGELNITGDALFTRDQERQTADDQAIQGNATVDNTGSNTAVDQQLRRGQGQADEQQVI
jgi:hypothetical protein